MSKEFSLSPIFYFSCGQSVFNLNTFKKRKRLYNSISSDVYLAFDGAVLFVEVGSQKSVNIFWQKPCCAKCRLPYTFKRHLDASSIQYISLPLKMFVNVLKIFTQVNRIQRLKYFKYESWSSSSWIAVCMCRSMCACMYTFSSIRSCWKEEQIDYW